MQSEANAATAKEAIVLSGGGGFGAFEVGVLKALASGRSPATAGEQPHAEIFTGTSVGAYNAAVLASHPELSLNDAVALLEDIWLNRIAGDLSENGVLRIRGNPLSLLDLNKVLRSSRPYLADVTSDALHLSMDAGKRLAGFIGSNSSFIARTMEIFDLTSFVSTEPLMALVGETVSLDNINRSKHTLKIATTNWMSGELRIFVHDPMRHDGNGHRSKKRRFSREEKLTREVWPSPLLASAAIPGVFPPVTIDGAPYVDGGVVMNTPLRPAVDAGATTVHLICLNPDATNVSMGHGLHVFERLMHLAVVATLNDDVEKIRHVNSLMRNSPQLTEAEEYREMTVHRYSPRMDLGGITGMLDFRADRIRHRIEIGEKSAVNHDCEKERCVLPGKPLA